MPNYNGLIQAVQNVGPQIQEGFERGRARRYRNNLAGALQGGDYEQASQIAFGQGDIETGLGMQEQIQSQQAAQAEARQQRQELYREATAEAAPAMMRIAEMEDPQQQQEALGVLTLTLQQRYPSIAQDIEQTAGQIFAGGPEAMRTAAQAMGAEVGGGAEVNQRLQTFEDEQGNLYEAITDPRNPNAPATYRPLSPGAPEQPQGALRRPSGSSDVEAVLNFVTEQLGGEGDDAPETAREILRFGLGLQDAYDLALRAGPDAFGTPGNVQRLAQNISQQVLAGRNMSFEGLRAQALAQARQPGSDLSPETVREFFNPDLSAIPRTAKLLAFQAASAVAGQEGRALSDRDLRRFEEIIGDPTGLLSSQPAFLEGLRALDREVINEIDANRLVSGQEMLPEGLSWLDGSLARYLSIQDPDERRAYVARIRAQRETEEGDPTPAPAPGESESDDIDWDQVERDIEQYLGGG